MSEQAQRLASLEAKMQIVLDMLKDIRDDLKDHPTREEFDKHLKNHQIFETEVRSNISEIYKEIHKVERKQNSIAIKVGIATGIIGIITGYLLKIVMLP